MRKIAIAFAVFAALILVAGCSQKAPQKPIVLENVDPTALAIEEPEPVANETISSTVASTEPEDLGDVV